MAHPGPSFAGRMQLPVVALDSGALDKLVIEFDFHDDSTGLDVVHQVLEQIALEYKVWTGDGTLEDMVVVCKEAGLEHMTPVSDRLVAKPPMRHVFVLFNEMISSGANDMRPPLLMLTTRARVLAVRDKIQSRQEATAVDKGEDEPAPSPDASKSAQAPVDAREHAAAAPLSSSITPRPPTPPQLAETSFSTLQLATDLPTMDALPALLDEAPFSFKVLDPQLRDFFGIDAASAPMDWHQIVMQVPVESALIEVAGSLEDSAILKWKELRASLLPGRKHWIHSLAAPPRRGAWLDAIQAEREALSCETSALAKRRDDLKAALEEARTKCESRGNELDKLEISAVLARSTIRKREELQQRYQDLRKEADEFRQLEDDLHRKLCARLETAAKCSKTDATPPPELPHPDAQDDVVRSASVVEDSRCFDDDDVTHPSTRDLAFLSPSLRDSVSAALNSSTADPVAPASTDKSGELRHLASTLQLYLNAGSPDASSRAELLEQVRKAREVVEQKRSFSRTATMDVRPAPLDQRGRIVVGSFVRQPSQMSLHRMDAPLTGRGTTSVSFLGGQASQSSGDYLIRQSASPHPYEVAPRAAASASMGREDSLRDASLMAERAVPFFQQ